MKSSRIIMGLSLCIVALLFYVYQLEEKNNRLALHVSDGMDDNLLAFAKGTKTTKETLAKIIQKESITKEEHQTVLEGLDQSHSASYQLSQKAKVRDQQAIESVIRTGIIKKHVKEALDQLSFQNGKSSLSQKQISQLKKLRTLNEKWYNHAVHHIEGVQEGKVNTETFKDAYGSGDHTLFLQDEWLSMIKDVNKTAEEYVDFAHNMKESF